MPWCERVRRAATRRHLTAYRYVTNAQVLSNLCLNLVDLIGSAEVELVLGDRDAHVSSKGSRTGPR
jgi:hypothetical protein